MTESNRIEYKRELTDMRVFRDLEIVEQPAIGLLAEFGREAV